MSSSALQIALLMLLVPQNVLERRKKGKYLPVLNFVNIIKYLQVVRFFKIKSYGVFFFFSEVTKQFAYTECRHWVSNQLVIRAINKIE